MVISVLIAVAIEQLPNQDSVRSALQSSVPSDVNPETFIRSFLNLAKH
jgi:hypothetical protein